MNHGSGIAAAAVALRLAVSVLCAGVCYAAWMGAFIGLADRGSRALQAGLWLAAPLVTAAGFAFGLTAVRRKRGTGWERFLRAYAWALVGCAVGAAAVFPFGPMLIVFGMFLVGTLTVSIREVLASRRNRH